MNCDRLAPIYQLLEYAAFGPVLKWCREEFIREISNCKRVLILGDGDSRFLAKFVRTSRAERIDSVDVSAGMLA